jgi:O-antigen/teichoic acid export membrane protein
VAAVALLIGLLGRPVIRIWAGPPAVPGRLLLWLMCGWVILLACGLNQAVLLSATSRIRLQAVYSLIGAAANLGLSIYLVRLIGVPGVLIGTLVSYILFGLAPQGYEVRNILRGDYLSATVC